MIVQCPDCRTKMKPKPPAATPEGAKVSITCRCGTKLRFTMPGKPALTESQQRFRDQMRETIDGMYKL